MSGLCDGRRRGRSSFRQQPSAPRRHACRRDQPQRARDDPLIRKRSTVVGHPHRPIHLHMGRPDMGRHLIEVPVVRHRPVTAQAPCGLAAQAPVPLAARRTGPVQISGLRRLMCRQPGSQQAHTPSCHPAPDSQAQWALLIDPVIALIVRAHSITSSARRTELLVRPTPAWDRIARWHQCFQAQPPFQELHMLTEPPTGNTEAEFVRDAIMEPDDCVGNQRGSVRSGRSATTVGAESERRTSASLA